jgi:hypothetical protein
MNNDKSGAVIGSGMALGGPATARGAHVQEHRLE